MTFLQRVKLWTRFRLWMPFRINAHASYYSSHSQFGEDMVVRGILGDRRDGTYVDIGAHHPVYFSNTYHFYLKGWSGLNVDAIPGSMEVFRLVRPRDINVEACVGPKEGELLQFRIFDIPALNTFDDGSADETIGSGRGRLIRTIPYQTRTLANLLSEHLSGRHVDLLSIDIEGMDEQVLRSNDWDRWRPSVVIFERDQTKLLDISDDSCVNFLSHHGYVLQGKCRQSLIMVDGKDMKP